MSYRSVGKLLVALMVAVLMLGGCAGPERPEREEPKDLVWPAPPEEPRIRYLRTHRGQMDFAKKDDLRARLLGVENKGVSLQKPYGVAVNEEGSRIYVTDPKQKAVVVFDLKRRAVFRMRTDAVGALGSPVEVRLDKRERIFVSDGYGGKVNAYNTKGETLFSIGKAEGIKRPTGLAIDDERKLLYVADTPNHRVVVYDLEGNYVKTIGERGTDPGSFNFPINLEVDGKGTLYVVDSGNFRVQMFSPESEYLGEFGEVGDGFGKFARPKGVAVDSMGHIYVLDAAFNNFQIFEPSGQLLLFVGTLGREPGMFWLPTGVFIDKEDKIYVVDSINARIQVFQYLPEEPGQKAASSENQE